MTRYDALSRMLHQFVVEVGTKTHFSMDYLIKVMERELRAKRQYPETASSAWMDEFVSDYRLVKAINKAYPNLSEMHPERVNICYYRR